MNPRPPTALVALAVILCLMAGVWGAGFLWFIRAAVRADIDPRPADGIVVLTGGADRIVTGIRLLQQGRGRVLLISGVGHNADLAALLRGTGIDPKPLAAQVTLGRNATSTTGNADETAAWAMTEHVQSLIVVTATYHMWRAEMELRRRLSGVQLRAYPVLPPALRGGGLLPRIGPIRLLASEYTKYLAAELGLTRLGSEAGRG